MTPPDPEVVGRAHTRDLSRLFALVLTALLAGTASAAPPQAPGLLPEEPLDAPHLLDCRGADGPAGPGYQVPGRQPNSRMPWEFFLGNASHRLIAYAYQTQYPTRKTFHNKETLMSIARSERLGDWTLLSESERNLRPDILDLAVLEVFEIKPCNERGLREGLRQVRAYLAALNRIAAPTAQFSGGRSFQGEMLVQFAKGLHIWRLEWRTTTPGVTLYRWTRSREHFNSASEAYQAQQWVEITEEELKQYGGWVAQAVEGMVERRERLASLSSAVGVAIDVVGNVAVLLISSGAPASRQTPAAPAAPGGKVLPFRGRPVPQNTPVLPAASGM